MSYFLQRDCVIINGEVWHRNIKSNKFYDLKEGENQVPVNDLTLNECIDIADKIDRNFNENLPISAYSIRYPAMKLKSIINANNINNIVKEIATIKDQVQNTTDIVNLFTDIDKHRTNTDDRIEKLEKEIYSLKESMDQILNLLQKS